MCYCWKELERITSIAAIGIVCLFTAQSFAQEQNEASILVEQPAPPQQPALALPEASVAEPIPGPVVTEAVAHRAPPTVYRASRRARRMFRCQEQVELVMVTKNPADCCLYEVCLCVPACCVGEPVVRERRGLLGRGVVEYCWQCGFTATVKFRERIGDVKVDYDA